MNNQQDTSAKPTTEPQGPAGRSVKRLVRVLCGTIKTLASMCAWTGVVAVYFWGALYAEEVTDNVFAIHLYVIITMAILFAVSEAISAERKKR